MLKVFISLKYNTPIPCKQKDLEKTGFGMENTVQSETSLTLDLPPSCIQFCPAHPQFFVIGTYNLLKDDSGNDEGEEARAKQTQSRDGSIILFKTNSKRMQVAPVEKWMMAMYSS